MISSVDDRLSQSYGDTCTVLYTDVHTYTQHTERVRMKEGRREEKGKRERS